MAKAQLVHIANAIALDWPRFTAASVVVSVVLLLQFAAIAFRCPMLAATAASNRIVPLSQVRCARPKATAAAAAAATVTDPQTTQAQVNICAKCAKWGYVMQSVNLLCSYDCLTAAVCVCFCVCVGVSANCGVLSAVCGKNGLTLHWYAEDGNPKNKLQERSKNH